MFSREWVQGSRKTHASSTSDVRRVDIDTHPAMPVMADGNPLGEGRVRIEVRRHALAVMVGAPAPEVQPGPGEIPLHH